MTGLDGNDLADAPLGQVSGYHLFWRPSARSKTALFHRPDICMPGSGWKQVGDVEKTEVDFGGTKLDFLVFRFEGLDLAVNPMLAGRFRLAAPTDKDEAALAFDLMAGGAIHLEDVGADFEVRLGFGKGGDAAVWAARHC